MSGILIGRIGILRIFLKNLKIYVWAILHGQNKRFSLPLQGKLRILIAMLFWFPDRVRESFFDLVIVPTTSGDQWFQTQSLVWWLNWRRGREKSVLLTVRITKYCMKHTYRKNTFLVYPKFKLKWPYFLVLFVYLLNLLTPLTGKK